MCDRWLSQVWRLLVIPILMVAALAGGAGATMVLNLGTPANATAWTGSVCGAVSIPVFQFGGAIGLAGGALTGGGRCTRAGGWIATEGFLLPAGAVDVTLRLSDFATTGLGELRLNGAVLAIDGAATVTAGLIAGGLNRLEIVFGGGGRPGLVLGSLGFAELTAGLSYEPAGIDAGAPVSEPHSGGVFAAVLLAIAVLWRGPGRPLVGRYSAAARRAPPSMVNV